MYEYEGITRKVYSDSTGLFGDAVFIPVCEKCKKFVNPDSTVIVSEYYGLIDTSNATCSKCGRTKMIFEGFI